MNNEKVESATDFADCADCGCRRATIKDVVCPVCFKQLTLPTIAGEIEEAYNRKIRTYFGWCFDCNKGCEVIQFKETGGRYRIYKYRLKIEKGLNKYLMSDWRILNEMPLPPAVVLGPCGDYKKPLELNENNIGLLKTIKTCSLTIAGAVGKLLKALDIND